MASSTEKPATARPNYVSWLGTKAVDSVKAKPTIQNGYAGPAVDTGTSPVSSSSFIPHLQEPNFREVSNMNC